MTQEPNEGYFRWLCDLTEAPRSRSSHRNYWRLLHQLHVTPFRWSIRNDDNREADGKDLRMEYADNGDSMDPDWPDAPASMLEMLIALSRRAAYESYGTPAAWFWKMIENLDMLHYTDANFDTHVAEDVRDALRVVIQRRYGADGRGGLFPLRYPRQDQRRVELGYQMDAYIIEGAEIANGP